MENSDPSDLPVVPDAPDAGDALSRASQQITGLDDDQVMKKMGRRTTTFGMVAGLTMIVGAGALGFVWYQRNEAYQHRWEAYNAAQEAESQAAFLAAIREELPRSQFDDVRMRIMQKMGEYRDGESVSALVARLDEPGRIRAHAARALARIGQPDANSARPDLLRVLPQCDERDRTPVVWALAVLGEAGAADAIVEEFAAGRLQHQHGFEARIITEVLGVSRLATPALTDHESVAVRTLVAQALAEAATPDVIDPLAHMIDHETQLEAAAGSEDANHASHDAVIRQAVAGLGRVGDPRAARPLFDLMQRNPGMRVAVLDALRRSSGARAIAVLLSSAGDAATKRDLAIMLRATHDPAAADALAGLLGSDDEMARSEAAHGLAELGDTRCVPVLLALASGESLEAGRDALDALALVQAPEAAGQLIQMLGDEERFLARRAGIMRALGATGSRDAGRELARHLEGDDIATAALALAALNDDAGFDALMRIIPRPRDVDFSQYMGMAGVPHQLEYDNRTAAVRAIARYGRPEAAEALMTIIEDPQDDIRLRNDAGLALGAVATDEILEQVITKIQQTDLDDAARRFYLGALWQHPSRALSPRLLELINNPATSPDVRRPASVALGYAADPANDARLITMLDSDETEREAAIAIALGGSEEAGRALLTHLGADAELRNVLQESLMNQENDWFNLVTSDLWDSGQVHRRLAIAYMLNQGEGDNRHGYAWTTYIARLQSGWPGVHGLSALEIRRRLFADLTGEDAARRRLAARAFGQMNELGLLMAARDGGGNGAEEARQILNELNRPPTDATGGIGDDDMDAEITGG